MAIPDGYWVRPHPNIRRMGPEAPYYGAWVCRLCGGIDVCYCLSLDTDNFGDPICDCGWPAYACCCNDEEAWIEE